MTNIANTKPLNAKESNIANTCAILSLFMYLDTQEAEYNEKTIGELIFNSEFEKKANPIYLRTIQDAFYKNPEIGDIKIVGQSAVDDISLHKVIPSDGFGKNLIIANAFELNNGDICVAYRGTGKGKWIDNGQGLGQENTVMQEAAARYFDYIYKKYGDFYGQKYFVTGHSKGGNEAQYTCMAARNNFKIKHCYTFDGQGFSPESINKFISTNGNNYYNRQVDKITSICGKNDFVNPLGMSIVRPENKYYIQTVNSKTRISGYHEMLYMFDQANPSKLNFKYNEKEEAISAEQGNLGKFAEFVSEKVMKLETEDRRDCGIAIMSIAEKLSAGGYGTGDIKNATIRHNLTFVAKGMPLVNEALLDKKMVDTIFGLCKELIDEGTKDKKFGKILGAMGIAMIYVTAYVVALPISKVLRTISKIADCTNHAVRKIGKQTEENQKMIEEFEKKSHDATIQELYNAITQEHGYQINKSHKNDWNMRNIAIESGNTPELVEIIALSSKEQFDFANKLHEENKNHEVVKYAEIIAELAQNERLCNEDGVFYSTKALQTKALHTTIKTAIEFIREGKSVILCLPEMYNASMRDEINNEIKQSLEKLNYILSAVVVDKDNIQRLKDKYDNINYSKQEIMLEENFPSNDDYNYVLTGSLNETLVKTISPHEEQQLMDYLDALDETFYGLYDLEELNELEDVEDFGVIIDEFNLSEVTDLEDR